MLTKTISKKHHLKKLRATNMLVRNLYWYSRFYRITRRHLNFWRRRHWYSGRRRYLLSGQRRHLPGLRIDFYLESCMWVNGSSSWLLTRNRRLYYWKDLLQTPRISFCHNKKQTIYSSLKYVEIKAKTTFTNLFTSYDTVKRRHLKHVSQTTVPGQFFCPTTCQ